MTCTNCGNQSHPGASHCTRCGMPQAPVPLPVTKQNTGDQSGGLGFMLLALLFVFDALVYKILAWVEIRDWDNPLITIYSWLVALSMWAIMIIFTRKTAYRVVVIVVAAILLGMRLWNQFSAVDYTYFEF
ncbi:MAG: hypothetical protein FD123_174 [Bacteroidetes bacterium]|nr:MAG: hypothetical protein FD123_174 [Bacteroidota bacterium]